jgi:hypothetical protein
MSGTDKKIYEQVYNVSNDVTLTSQVTSVVCLLTRRGIMTSGFNTANELLIIHYNGYNAQKPVWALDFFEQLFSQDPLLGAKEKIKGVFTCTDKFLIIPAALYNEKDAKTWLKQIHYIEKGDVIEAHTLGSGKLHHVSAVPVYIPELVKINFKKAIKLPLAACQFENIATLGLRLQCCLMQEEVCVTLHSDGQLLWHTIIAYSSAEDIAYEVKHFCRNNNLDSTAMTVTCNTVSATEYPAMAELSRYFPGIKAGDGSAIHTAWDGAVSLAKQLLACA